MKKTLIKIGIGITIIALIAGLGSNMLSAATSANPYDDSGKTLKEIEKLYHTRINDTFNSKLKLMEGGKKGGGTNKIVSGDACEEKNYSTFCLALAVEKEYQQYKLALEAKRGSLILEEGEENITLENATAKFIAQKTEIETEIDLSRRALEVSLKTYNELAIQYAMHLKYQDIIKSLGKYKTKLNTLYDQVKEYPNKFIDATTTQCT